MLVWNHAVLACPLSRRYEALLAGHCIYSLEILVPSISARVKFFSKVKRSWSLSYSMAESAIECMAGLSHSSSDLLGDSLLIICMRSWTTSDICGLYSRSGCKEILKIVTAKCEGKSYTTAKSKSCLEDIWDGFIK